MGRGFFTIEQWRQRKWQTVDHLAPGRTLTDAIKELECCDQSGFFRIVQTQRMIWAEKSGGKLRLRKWHANSLESLLRTAKAFDRDGGKWPAKARKTT
jgi:hypothetical protein